VDFQHGKRNTPKEYEAHKRNRKKEKGERHHRKKGIIVKPGTSDDNNPKRGHIILKV